MITGIGTTITPPRLSGEERALLEIIAEGRPVTLARRARIILSWDEGRHPDEVAEQLGLTASTVKRALNTFFKQRLMVFPLDSLMASAQRRTPDYPAEAEAAVALPLTVEELCRRNRVDMNHARHVSQLARALFDLTHAIHRLDPYYAGIVEKAAMLTTVGFAKGAKPYHLRGRDLLMNGALLDLSDEDRLMVAAVVGLHRKRWRPSRAQSDPAYAALPEERRSAALWLTALVRIADGLDDSHRQRTRLGPSKATHEATTLLLLGPTARRDARQAHARADLWRLITSIPTRFIPIIDDQDQGVPDLLKQRVTPQKVSQPQVSPAEAMSEAGRDILRFYMHKMLQNEAGTRLGEDIEALHDMRVAVRRQRAALEIFMPFFAPRFVKWLLGNLREAGRILGTVRDLDVQIEEAQAYLQTLQSHEQNSLDSLIAHWQMERDEARIPMLNYLDSDRYINFLERYAEFCETPGLHAVVAPQGAPAAMTVAHVGPSLIYARDRGIRAYESLLPTANLETLHSLRRDLKRMRYLLEAFQPSLGPETKGVIATLVRAQDALGQLNDANVTRMLLWDYLGQFNWGVPSEGNPVAVETLAGLEGVAAYLRSCEARITSIRDKVPAVWDTLTAPEFRQKLASAVSVL